MTATQSTIRRHGDRDRKLTAQGLAPRQLEALLYIAQGLTDKQAAEKMGIKPGTVKKIRASIHYKLNTHNSAGMITKAFEMGFLRFITLVLAWLIGTAAIHPNQAWSIRPETPEENQGEQTALRLRSRNHGRNRRPQRSRRANNKYRVTKTLPTDICTWCEETNRLYINNQPISALTGGKNEHL